MVVSPSPAISTSPLMARLAALREQHNTSIHSELRSTSTSLSAYLALYNKATTYGASCYTDHMLGAKALYSYLSPIAVPEISPALLPPAGLLHSSLLHGYAIDQLAQIFYPITSLTPNEAMSDILAKRSYISRVIIYLLITSIDNIRR